MNDERLRRLLADSVSEIEPAERIEELRASVRSSPRVVPATRARSWYAAAGIGATAAVIGVVAFVTHVATDRSTDVGAATDGGTGRPSATATAVDTSVASHSPGADPGRAALYYLGAGPHATVLYRELSVPYAGASPLGYAITGLMSDPADPDYRTPWRPGWLVRASSDGHLIRVELGRAPTSRPRSMTARDAAEAVQQVVYTLQAAVHRNERVQFVRHGRQVASVLGVPTSEPVAAGRAVQVLSLMSIGDPGEGARIPRGRLVVAGVNNAYEANVVVRLVRDGATYAERPAAAVGTYDRDRMFPWRVTIPTGALLPGRYRLVASNGGGLGRDTRTIVLE
jgi:hypothetical protein